MFVICLKIGLANDRNLCAFKYMYFLFYYIIIFSIFAVHIKIPIYIKLLNIYIHFGWKCGNVYSLKCCFYPLFFSPKTASRIAIPRAKKHLLQLIDMKSNSIISFVQKGNTHFGTLVRICIFLLQKMAGNCLHSKVIMEFRHKLVMSS